MQIRSVKLTNYRNYSRYFLDFHSNLNIIIGKNGVGKTNILESIIVVSNTKSFRTTNDTNLIKKNSEYSRIEIDSDTGYFKVVINNKNKSLFLNNNIVKKTSEYIGKLNAILFIPDDIGIFNDAPSFRRRIIDIEIGKVSKRYLDSSLKYNLLLKDKNKILKEENINEILLESIEDLMVPYIQTIIEEREKFFEIINSYINQYYEMISGKKDEIKIIYKKCADISKIKEEMISSRSKDEYYHYSTFGPHHEDYIFKFNNIDLVNIASQGQKRMVMIAFKFSLIRYIKEITNIMPIILLDDILSELDLENKQRLLKMIPKDAQVIITDTNIMNLKIDRDYKLIKVEGENNG